MIYNVIDCILTLGNIGGGSNIFNVAFLIENHQRHQSMRSLANYCRKHSPPPRSVIRALLCPSMDLELRLDHPPMRILYSGIC